jgi:prolyl-tRNA synthetase
MPNGRTLQVGTYHHYRDQWAKSFDLKYEDENGDSQYCHQTTFGMSERLLGAIVGLHGDDKGLIFPPSVSPIQVIIMPIASHISEDVMVYAKKIESDLLKSGIRTKIDDRNIRPGTKHYDWEIKGVPIRLEIGPRDISDNKCVISLRTGGKESIDLDDLGNSVLICLDLISNTLRENAKEVFDGMIHNLPDFSIVNGELIFSSKIQDDLIYELPFDGNDSDAEILEKSTGLTLLGECENTYQEQLHCVITGKLTNKKQHLAKMY